MNELVITVTQEDVDTARQILQDPTRPLHEVCAVAQAVKRLYPGRNVSCGSYNVAIAHHDHDYSYYGLPAEARQFIKQFDKGLLFTQPLPFTFRTEEHA